MPPELLDNLLNLAATLALSVGAWFFRELRAELKELRRELAELRIQFTAVEQNKQILQDHEQRLRALERKVAP